jgi:NitT/TauT family transport system substrate-binding protein
MESTRTLMRLFAITSLLALILAACTPVAPSSDGGNQADRDSLVPITLGVGYVPNVQFAPLYVGIEKGFFRDAGLEVNLEYGY